MAFGILGMRPISFLSADDLETDGQAIASEQDQLSELMVEQTTGDDISDVNSIDAVDESSKDDEFDFSEQMLSLADSEGIDLMDDELDLSDFDFTDENETDKVS